MAAMVMMTMRQAALSTLCITSFQGVGFVTVYRIIYGKLSYLGNTVHRIIEHNKYKNYSFITTFHQMACS